jgi:hypothetical protein
MTTLGESEVRILNWNVPTKKQGDLRSLPPQMGRITPVDVFPWSIDSAISKLFDKKFRAWQVLSIACTPSLININ